MSHYDLGVTLITGASRGIGLAFAEEAARRGAKLHLVSRKFEAGIAARMTSLGAQSVQLYERDLAKPLAAKQLVAELDEKKVQVETVFNNAGLLTGGLLESQDPEEIQAMLQVNVSTLILLTRYLLPGLLERKRGLIVNNASVSGKMFFPCASTYAASKAAVVAFTECLKQELEGTGVSTLLLITPGVQTNMYSDISKLYGDNLDLSFMKAMPAEKWIQKIFEAIDNKQSTLWPDGSSRIGVLMGHHIPKVFEKIIGTKFKR